MGGEGKKKKKETMPVLLPRHFTWNFCEWGSSITCGDYHVQTRLGTPSAIKTNVPVS